MADLFTSLGDFLGLNKGKATTDAANKNASVLNGLNTTGGGYLADATNLDKGLLGEVGKGADLYSGALGINGADGTAAARDAFTTTPGYEFSRDQGIQALDRTAASRGALGGGGEGVDIANYVTNGANNQWSDWLNHLSGFQQQLPGATGAVTAGLGNQTQFAEDIASGKMGANNQAAAGEEAGQGGLWNLLGNAASVVGAGVGAATGMRKLGAAPAPSFGGYGSF